MIHLETKTEGNELHVACAAVGKGGVLLEELAMGTCAVLRSISQQSGASLLQVAKDYLTKLEIAVLKAEIMEKESGENHDN